MIFSLISCALVSSPMLFASEPVAPLKLCPSPVSVKRDSGSFSFDENTPIRCDAFADDQFAVSQLALEVKADLGISLKSDTPRSSHSVILSRIPQLKDQGYILVVAPDGIRITASTSDGIFYGVQTLKQLIRANRDRDNSIPACTIKDYPALQYRGWQHDISRGPIPTLAFLKKEIRTLSEFKLNMFTLYTEHVFKLKKHPTIAPNDGITASEIKELSAYGKQYHVEVVGNFQSFGHFANILSVKGYESLGENSWVLSPAKEESYKFLSDVYSEIAPAYDSPLFNINCDEVSGLGEGPSKDMVRDLGVAGVYAKHINRIADLLKHYKKTPMMWGDIALNYPAIVPLLPKDLIVLPWAYDARASFEDQILPFTKYGLRFMVCPGVSCWSQIWPDTQNASTNISNFARDGARLGAIGVLNTAWDDDGLNFSNDNWYEYVWGAECSWSPVRLDPQVKPEIVTKNREHEFDSVFPAVFYGISGSELSGDINHLSLLRRSPISGGMNNGALWRDPVQTYAQIRNQSALDEFRVEAGQLRKAFQTARSKAKVNADSLDYAVFAASEAVFLSDSLLAIQKLKAGDESMAKALEGDAVRIKTQYTKLWARENRPWWLSRNVTKFDALIKRIHDLTHRVVIESASREDGRSPITIHSLSSLAKIYYTTDGSEPTIQSAVYIEPIRLKKTCTLKAMGIWPNGDSSPLEAATYYLPRFPAKIITNLGTYEDYLPVKAIDGSLDTFFWSGGPLPQGGTFQVNLDEPTEVSSIKVVTGHPDHSGDFLHNGILEVSEDAKSFIKVADFKNGFADASLAKQMIKSVRLTATSGQSNWLVIREIELK